MSRDSQAALALAVGSAAILITMAFHPTGADMVQGPSAHLQTTLGRVVHALAIGAMPLLTTGLLAVSWRLRQQVVLSLAATVSYLLAVVAIMIAAATSGFIASSVAERIVSAAGSDRELFLQQLHYTGTINQAFAKVFVGLTSMAFLFWSLAMRAHGRFPRGLWLLGIIVSAAQGLGMASGHLRLDVQGFGAVVVAQAVWMLWVAWTLRHPDVPHVDL
jgi:hypothetical protein